MYKTVLKIKYIPRILQDLGNSKYSVINPERKGPKNSPIERIELNNPDAKQIHFSWSFFSKRNSKVSIIDGSVSTYGKAIKNPNIK